MSYRSSLAGLVTSTDWCHGLNPGQGNSLQEGVHGMSVACRESIAQLTASKKGRTRCKSAPFQPPLYRQPASRSRSSMSHMMNVP